MISSTDNCGCDIYDISPRNQKTKQETTELTYVSPNQWMWHDFDCVLICYNKYAYSMSVMSANTAK